MPLGHHPLDRSRVSRLREMCARGAVPGCSGGPGQVSPAWPQFPSATVLPGPQPIAVVSGLDGAGWVTQDPCTVYAWSGDVQLEPVTPREGSWGSRVKPGLPLYLCH